MKYGVTHHFQTMAHSLQTDNLNVLVTYQQYKPYKTIIRQYPFQATSHLSMARTDSLDIMDEMRATYQRISDL